MGSKVTKECWCDTCGKTFKDGWTFYHKHDKYSGGSALWHLSRRIEKANSEEEAFDELCEHFGFSKGDSVCNVGHAFYDEEVIKCIIDGMRSGMIHNEGWQFDGDPETLSNHKVAEFIERNVSRLKKTYNDFIEKAVINKRKMLDKFRKHESKIISNSIK
jgi:hypothetical protein